MLHRDKLRRSRLLKFQLLGLSGLMRFFKTSFCFFNNLFCKGYIKLCYILLYVDIRRNMEKPGNWQILFHLWLVSSNIHNGGCTEQTNPQQNTNFRWKKKSIYLEAQFGIFVKNPSQPFLFACLSHSIRVLFVKTSQLPVCFHIQSGAYTVHAA